MVGVLGVTSLCCYANGSTIGDQIIWYGAQDREATTMKWPYQGPSVASVWVLPRVVVWGGGVASAARSYAGRARLCGRQPQQQESLSRQNSHKRMLAQYTSQSVPRHSFVHNFIFLLQLLITLYPVLPSSPDISLSVIMLWSISAIQTCMSNIIRVSYLCQYLSVLFVSNTRDSNANEPMFIFVNQLYWCFVHKEKRLPEAKCPKGCCFCCLPVEADVARA